MERRQERRTAGRLSTMTRTQRPVYRDADSATSIRGLSDQPEYPGPAPAPLLRCSGAGLRRLARGPGLPGCRTSQSPRLSALVVGILLIFPMEISDDRRRTPRRRQAGPAVTDGPRGRRPGNLEIKMPPHLFKLHFKKMRRRVQRPPS